MRKLLSILLPAVFFAASLHATHNRAGEITFRQISGLTFEITITTYTKESAPADRPYLPINWGDGISDSLPRSNGPGFPGSGEVIAPDIKKNIYIGTHLYPGASTYNVNFEDPNRIASIVNIPGSVNIPFYIESKLIISNALGYNNSVQLLQPPIDDGVVGSPFIHNPNAYDPDGDSLSYTLIDCKGSGGAAIPGFYYPPSFNTPINIDPITGDFIWDYPTAIGIYNFAFLIIEWRNGYQIGYVERDMQVTIVASPNVPPVISSLPDICVEAGTLLSFNVTATNPLDSPLTLSATGAPFSFVPDAAQFTPVAGTATVSSLFTWQTTCAHIRKQPYQITFKAESFYHGQPNLADLNTMRITVVAPSPKNPAAIPLGSSILLSWDKEVCDVLADSAKGYYIYRRNGYYGFIPAQCELGVPAYTGYSLIGTVLGINTINFTDNNNGAGLIPGIDYCYMVVAFYKDGAQSYASLEVCTHLKKDIPVITNISVTKTDATIGTMYVAWSKPTELDTQQFPGPYEYKVFRSTGYNGDNLSFVTSFNDLNDTIYNDAGLNTLNNPYSYVIELHNAANGFIGKTQVASSVFISVTPSYQKLDLSWQENVPWNNDTFVIYKQNGAVWDSIGFTNVRSYTDNGLVNGTEYCYYVKSIGSYSSPGFVDPIINFSQEICGKPIDNVPPCISDLDTADFDCGSPEIKFTWIKPDNSCASDLDHYNIYYSPSDGTPYTLLTTIENPNTTTYTFSSIESIAGCFYITAVDTNNNESGHTNEICVDNCPYYELPNIFTPDGNGKNDDMHAFPWLFVKDINLHIYNRWGQEVFNTTDRDFRWNGKVNNTGEILPDGVYYYHCTVNEIYRSGIKERALKPGFVQLLKTTNGTVK